MTKPEQIHFKEQLKAACIGILQERIDAAQLAMDAAQEGANGNDKSSAGDKYETSRAMGHIDRDMYARQLEDARHEMGLINSLNTSLICMVATFGAVVECSTFTFFISRGLGNVTIAGQKAILLSPQAPVAIMMQGKKAGDSFVMNGKAVKVLGVF